MSHIFLAECFVPDVDEADVEAAAARAREAVAGLRRAGVEIAYLGAVLVAADEVVFHAFEAADAATAREASLRAGLPFERVVESVTVPPDALAALTGSPPTTHGTARG